jgi:hypothetical protein
MKRERIADLLRTYFPGAFKEGALFSGNPDGEMIVRRLSELEKLPLDITHFNQLLHLVHEAGVTSGFFKYYFLTAPQTHPYPVAKIKAFVPADHIDRIGSLDQIDWGMCRLYTDALLYFGNIRTAYRTLRTKSYDDLVRYFEEKRTPTERLLARGPVLAFHKIPVDDRYLIAEVACKAYSKPDATSRLLVEQMLRDQYKKRGITKLRIGDLFDQDSAIAKEDPHGQYMLSLAADELKAQTIDNEEQIHDFLDPIYQRFELARAHALNNTRMYLSLVNELDVYAATRMRTRDDFRNMARDCEYIFRQPALQRFRPRYFDPTMSAAEGHEDKGLIECLMVKCCRALLYFAGTGDSFGKDAEVAMAMSLGKPVVILCPDDERGEQRAKFFKDIHPLSRLIHFDSGTPSGAAVTRDRNIAATLLARILGNEMEYDFTHDGKGYFRLRERLTQSVVRLQTSDRLLRETFWNYYHGIP